MIAEAVEFYTTGKFEPANDWDLDSLLEYETFADQWLLEEWKIFLINLQISLLKMKLVKKHVVCFTYQHYDDVQQFWFILPSSLMPELYKMNKYWSFDNGYGYGDDTVFAKRGSMDLVQKEEVDKLKAEMETGKFDCDNLFCYNCDKHFMHSWRKSEPMKFCKSCGKNTLMHERRGDIIKLHEYLSLFKFSMKYYFVFTDEDRTFYHQEMTSNSPIISTVFKWKEYVNPITGQTIHKCTNESPLQHIQKEDLAILANDIDGITFIQ